MCSRITSFRVMSDDSKIVHVKCVVLRARNLIAKGKGGNNDVFVTIQLGKEKYQTSTIKGARNPEWFEECDLPIPHLHSEIEVTVYHRGVLSDDFLGHASIPLWEQKIHPQPSTQWIKLRNKPGRESDGKSRGEIEVKVTFHCHSRVDHVTPSGLKKRSSSLRNLASAVGDRFKFARSRSLRENRRDPEGGKTGDRNLNSHGSLQDIPEEGLARGFGSYSGTMSVDRGHVLTYNGIDTTGGGDLRTQSLMDIAGNRHSMVELPSSQPPPPYHPRPSSHDDMTLLLRPLPRRPPGVSFANSTSLLLHSHYPPDSRRERPSRRYPSIRERTEPESTSTSSEEDSQPRRRSMRPPLSLLRSSSARGFLRSRPASEEVVMASAQDLSSTPLGGGDASKEGGPGAGGGVGGGGERLGGGMEEPQRSELITNGSLQVERGTRTFPGPGSRHKSASSGELTTLNGEVRLRKRTKRERSRSHRQGSGRLPVAAGLERAGLGGVGVGGGGGLYDDSMSEPGSEPPKAQVTEDLFSVYRNLSKEELLGVVIQNKAQLIRKDQYIRDLEGYIDNLLVRVMETQPRILTRMPLNLPQHR